MGAALMHRTIAATIAAELRSAILSGEHAPGLQLRQDMLAGNFGVSRIPVREALLQLEAEGLVSITPHKGAVVTGLSPEEVEDIFALRRLLEPRLALVSVPRLAPADLEHLDATQNAFSAAIAAGDAARWGRLNAELHLGIYARAEQPRTLAIVTGLLQTSERYTRIQLATRVAWRRAQLEHAEIVALCRARNAQAVAVLLEQHIGAVQNDLARIAGRDIREENA
jgi:DNA-binding GntR family transcriptional regulator